MTKIDLKIDALKERSTFVSAATKKTKAKVRRVLSMNPLTKNLTAPADTTTSNESRNTLNRSVFSEFHVRDVLETIYLLPRDATSFDRLNLLFRIIKERMVTPRVYVYRRDREFYLPMTRLASLPNPFKEVRSRSEGCLA